MSTLATPVPNLAESVMSVADRKTLPSVHNSYLKQGGLKSSLSFLAPEMALAGGLVAAGGELDWQTLYVAYSRGIFPWPTGEEGEYPWLWFCPEERGVLKFKDYREPASFKKFKQKTASQWHLTWNQDFEAVIEACRAAPRPGQRGTWIHQSLKRAYIEFHHRGFAHSVECWRGPELIGGFYGVLVEGIFSGESMFYKVSGASKLCLSYACETLNKLGLSWMDTQMVTPVTEAFGACSLPREEYLKMMELQRARLRV